MQLQQDTIFPGVVELARRVLPCPPSTAPVERIFSVAGQVEKSAKYQLRMQHWQCRRPCARCGTWFNEAHQNIAVTPNALPFAGYTGVCQLHWQTLPVYCTGTPRAASTPAYASCAWPSKDSGEGIIESLGVLLELPKERRPGLAPADVAQARSKSRFMPFQE